MEIFLGGEKLYGPRAMEFLLAGEKTDGPKAMGSLLLGKILWPYSHGNPYLLGRNPMAL